MRSEARQPVGLAPTALSGRFTFVDALRGLAALAVVGFHFHIALSADRTRAVFGQPFDWILDHGNSGVQIFFVLSGFVIAHSLRQARITPSFAGRFLLRRSLRLDPPYWATIGLAILATLVAVQIKGSAGPALPSAWQLFLHVFYLQEIAGVGHVVEVFWTLCLEVQFYLSFVLLLGGAQRSTGAGRSGVLASPSALLVFFLPLTLLSLAIQFEILPSPWPGLMLKSWHLFALGVLTSMVLNRTLPRAWLGIYLAVFALFMTYRFDVRCLVGALTAVSLFAVGELRLLQTAGNLRPLQYLGRVSYSLYLVHVVVGCPFTYYFYQRVGGAEAGLGVRLGLFVLAVMVSLAAAHLLYRFVEQPSLGWSRWVPLHPEPGEGLAPSVPRVKEPVSLPARTEPTSRAGEVTCVDLQEASVGP